MAARILTEQSTAGVGSSLGKPLLAVEEIRQIRASIRLPPSDRLQAAQER
jgi:hypothetical protein